MADKEFAIQVRGLGKKYTLGGPQERGLTFREAIVNSVKAPFRSFSSKANPSEEFWALKDVSFDIESGEIVGIIGRNGAGKSTLLKILSRITSPTEGTVDLYGRVGSLLEVGTGFHPELTGRENIFLSGSILGMKNREIEEKLDEIVKFSEIDKFLDTPVKRFSSGMYVRLAFAIAAHLEPEILLVDEVLAVGDASFQKKCLGKMNDVAKEGRTVLFVSHNMGAVANLCTRGILLHHGKIISIGPISKTINTYLDTRHTTSAEVSFEKDSSKKIQIRRITLFNDQNIPSLIIDRTSRFLTSIEYDVNSTVQNAGIGFMLEKTDGLPVCHSNDLDATENRIIPRQPGYYREVVEFPGNLLNAGVYSIRIGIGTMDGIIFDHREAFSFEIIENGGFASFGAEGKQRPGLLALPLTWVREKIY